MNQEGRIRIEFDEESNDIERLLEQDIFITNEMAMMSEKILHALPTYSHSNPTGVRAGKMWKRHILIGEKLNMACLNSDGAAVLEPVKLERGYVFCWMEPSNTDPGVYNIIGKPVHIMDWKTMLGM